MFCKYTPAVLKKELWQAIILEAHPDLPKGKATITHPRLSKNSYLINPFK